MSKVSKLSIYIPSLLLIVALVLVFTAPKKDKKNEAQVLLSLTPTITPTPSIQIKIDLKGPFTCDYQSKSASVSAFIKDKQIAADFVEATQSSHVIVKGDCYYSWLNGAFVGQKQCGIKTALDTLDFLSSMGLLDVGSMMSMLPKSSTQTNTIQDSVATNEGNIQKFLQTCVKQEPSPNAFELPPTVQFFEPTAVPTPRI